MQILQDTSQCALHRLKLFRMAGRQVMEFVGIGLAIGKPGFPVIGNMIHLAPLLFS